jgi:hypothetical protein
MKINKSILAAALCLGLAGSSYAQSFVYLTGSTAMRGTMFNVLAATNVIFNGAPAITADSSTVAGANGATHMVFAGTLRGGSGTTVITTSWSGSEAGILAVASNTVSAYNGTYIISGYNTVSNTTATYSGSVTGEPADLAMADNDVTYSRTPNGNYGPESEVGIVTFKWVRNNGVWTGANTNVTDSAIQQALSGGTPLASFTGNAADTSWVFVSGRDNLSGTRVNALAESGYGIFTPVEQCLLSGGVMQNLGANGDSAYKKYLGGSGSTSGGSLAGSLSASTVSSTNPVYGGNGFSVIAYLGYNDAYTAITNAATELAFNGVGYSPANIREGLYTFWGNEYVVEAATVVSGSAADTVYNAIAANTPSFCYPTGSSNPNGIDLTWMHCTRTGPLSPPSHN